jgi:hypothetical protein
VYTTSTQLLVTSSEAPYFVTTVRRDPTVPIGRGTGITAGPGLTDQSARDRVAPDTDTLVRAANLYPILIESDPVAQLREKMFGPLPGSVSADAVGAISTPSRVIPSDTPVIQIQATAFRPDAAIALADATAKAFTRWLEDQQEQADVAAPDRIIVEQVASPKEAARSGGQDISLPILVTILMAAAWVVFVVVLDRVLPEPRRSAEDVAGAGASRGR